MTRILAIILALCATAALAQDASATDAAVTDESALARWEADKMTVFSASEIDLDDFMWVARPVVVFADSPNNPAFREQLDLLLARPDDLIERDVVVVTDTDPDTLSDIRRKLRPRGFQLTLIGKDGQVELRKPAPWNVRELSRSIDKMPLRQQEIREGR